MQIQQLPKQPATIISYWNVGKLLYAASILFILETFLYYHFFWLALQNEQWLSSIFWFSCVLFAFSHIFMVLADAWSRFQNYKRIKDLFYEHGFSYKLAAHYRGSKCQRMAVIAAAKELGIDHKVERYYYKLGIRWYHFIPQFMIEDPYFIVKSYFWSKTFLEKKYTPKYNYKKLNQQTLHATSATVK